MHIKEFDLIDEKKLSADNMRNLISLLYVALSRLSVVHSLLSLTFIDPPRHHPHSTVNLLPAYSFCLRRILPCHSLRHTRYIPDQRHFPGPPCPDRFGVPLQSIPHPEADWAGFYAAVSGLNEREGVVWSPATRVMAKWIDMQNLDRAYGLASQNTGRGPAPSAGPAMRQQQPAKSDGCCVVA